MLSRQPVSVPHNGRDFHKTHQPSVNRVKHSAKVREERTSPREVLARLSPYRVHDEIGHF
jgi:hypothetical protein